jgi:hypothetical protein
MEMFLDKQQLADLTGFKMKSKQVAQLRKMGLPFFLNGRGEPKVTVSAVEGRKVIEESKARTKWSPSWVENRQ